jgi:DNA repair protein RadC
MMVPRIRISAVYEDGTEYAHAKITDVTSAIDLLAPGMADADREIFVVVLLDTKHVPIGTNIVSIGTLNASFTHPREVFKPAILLGASAIIISHNHPSGDPTPSREDIAITRRLEKAGEILGIQVLDHIIIGRGRHWSVRGDGYNGH